MDQKRKLHPQRPHLLAFLLVGAGSRIHPSLSVASVASTEARSLASGGRVTRSHELQPNRGDEKAEHAALLPQDLGNSSPFPSCPASAALKIRCCCCCVRRGLLLRQKARNYMQC